MQIKENFPQVLKKRLLIKYGYIPSNSMFANHFNLKSLSHKTITRETARRWLSGESFPQLDNFYTLTSWLEFTENDLNTIFDLQEKEMTPVSVCSDLKKLFEAYEGLFDNQKRLLIVIAEALIRDQGNIF